MFQDKNVSTVKSELLASQSTPVTEDFNWDEDSDYSTEEKSKMMSMYESTMMDMTENRIRKGTVISVNEKEAVVNIGFKSEGIVPLSEFRDKNLVKPGDEVEVYLETIENKQGALIISLRKANSIRTWERINNAMDEDIIMEGVVMRRTKGGFVVDLEGIEAFLPGSQIDVKPIRDYDFYVGRRMEFKVVKINHVQNNVVISHKALIEKDLEAQKSEIINNLDKGQILEGVVKNITNFGVFIDLGGVDGLLHITDISWGRVNDPHEVLKYDQKINVCVLDFDEDRKRISLGLKQLTPHPWENLPETISVSSKVKGKVVTIADYGIFIEILPGVEGLIHVSEMSWSQHPKSPGETFTMGEEVEAVVLSIEPEARKMSLGIKQLTTDPWSIAVSKYEVGTRHFATVRNITNYGLFVELEDGIDGLIHILDLSWSKKINHPSEFIQKDEKLEVIVLELDIENRKIRLGHKQLTDDPWLTFETVFPVGSVHQGTITKLIENKQGATVELAYGVEGYIPQKGLKVEDGKEEIKEGDQITAKVIEFNRENRKLVLSHYLYWNELLNPKKDKEAETTTEGNESGKGTFGDLINEEALKAAVSDSEEDTQA